MSYIYLVAISSELYILPTLVTVASNNSLFLMSTVVLKSYTRNRRETLVTRESMCNIVLLSVFPMCYNEGKYRTPTFGFILKPRPGSSIPLTGITGSVPTDIAVSPRKVCEVLHPTGCRNTRTFLEFLL